MIICILAIYTFAVHDGKEETCRPRIGFDKADAIALAREIGTFEESTSHVTGCRAVRQGAACGDPGDRAGDGSDGDAGAGVTNWIYNTHNFVQFNGIHPYQRLQTDSSFSKLPDFFLV
jgi:hypothetical protein